MKVMALDAVVDGSGLLICDGCKGVNGSRAPGCLKDKERRLAIATLAVCGAS